MLATLEIDAGNSSAKWRLVSLADRAIVSHGSMMWSDVKTGCGFVPLLDVEVTSAVIASVAGDEKTASLVALLRSRFPFIVIRKILSAKQLAGVRFAYSDPSTLGVDRCLAMVAAYSWSQSSVLVLDCGSALTADFVDSAGCHIGGYIFPGVRLLRESLRKGTAFVPVGNVSETDDSPGSSTQECVDRAVSLMFRSTVMSLLEYAGSKGISRRVITGGDARWVSSLVSVDFFHSSDLVLDGVALVADTELDL